MKKKHEEEIVWIDLLRAGSQDAFAKIYNRYWSRLLAVAINRLSDQHEAEDCVQDVFLSLWLRRESMELSHNISTYLGAAVKYQIINRLEKRYSKPKAEYSQSDNICIITSPETELIEKELWERVEATVSRLPEKCRLVYCMSRKQNKNNKEISDELGVSEKTVEGHITRALRDIREILLPIVLITITITFLQVL